MLIEEATMKREDVTAVIIEECGKTGTGCPNRYPCGGQSRCKVS
ncbi:MAG: hypothetical protein ACP5EQ_04235 [Candidatus Cloacimonadia bacterium]